MSYKTTKRNDRNLTTLSMLRSERSLSKMEVSGLEQKLEHVENWNCLNQQETDLFNRLTEARMRVEDIQIITAAFEILISGDIPNHQKDDRSI